MATRTERVVLELEDSFTTGMAKAATATALLKRELGGLDGSNQKTTTSTKKLGDETDRLSTRAVKGRNEIDKFSGRLTVLAQVAAGVGPALVPIGAIGIPAAAGLANELAGVALGAGTALLAFHGLGDGLSALNKAALDPTVTNLQAAQLALEKLPPSARDFARELSAMQPTIARLREAAAQGLFPGLEDALTQLHTRSGEVEKILFRVGTELGDLSRRGAEALSGPEWDNFFKFVAREAPAALEGLGRATGDVVHGLAQLWMAFAPLNQDFTGLIVDAADGFDRWASGLAKTQGFTDFITYLRTNGPLVADAVVAIGNAVLQIVEAAAPLGGPILQALTSIANAVSTIADSKAGPTILATVTALSLLSRAQASFGKISSASWVTAIRSAETFQGKVAAARGPAIRGGLAIAGLGLAASGAADKIHLANTATLAMTGSLAGPWGAAAGGAVGLLLDISKGFHQVNIDSATFTATLNQQTGAITNNTAKMVAQSLEQQGLLARAQEFGLSTQQLTGFVLGQKDATEQVNTALDKYAQAQRVIVGRGSSAGQAISGQAAAAGSLADALGDARGQSQGLVDGFHRQQDAAKAVAGSFDSAKSAAERFRLEIDRVNDVLAHRASLRDYQQALDDFADRAKQRGDIMVQIAQAQSDLANAKTKSARDSARANIKSLQDQADALKDSLDIGTQAGRDTQAAIDAIAQSALAAAQTLKGAAQARFLANARQEFIDTTKDILGSKKAAEDLATKLGLIDRVHVKPKIDLQYNEAVGGIKQVARELAALHDKTIHIRAISNVHTGGTQLGLAAGGTIPGPRAPYGDKVLAALAPGEEVISNLHGQADQHRALLKAINSQRYADGGTVAASRSSSWSWSTTNMTSGGGGVEIDYGRLTRALLAARPIYGDVHMQPHDYNEFRRQQGQDHAMAEMSGVSRGD